MTTADLKDIVPLITLLGVILTFAVGVFTLLNTRRLEFLKEVSGFRKDAFCELQAARKRLQTRRTTIASAFPNKDNGLPNAGAFLKEFRDHYMDDYDEYKTICHLLSHEQRVTIDGLISSADKADAECFSSIIDISPDSPLPSDYVALLKKMALRRISWVKEREVTS